MTETHPIPTIAKTAASLVFQNFQRDLQVVTAQTRDAMGLTPEWDINFDTGMASREVPDPPKGDKE